MLIPAATCYTLILPQIHTSCDHGVPHADRAQVTRTHTCGSIKQPRGLLMITSIMRLLIPGANFTSRGRFQREALCVCVHLYEETWTHPSTGTKKKNSAATLHSFHNVIFVLSQHSQSGLWSCFDMWLTSCCAMSHRAINLLFLCKKWLEAIISYDSW